MKLTDVQAFIMNLLKTFRCLRKKQVMALLCIAFGCGKASAEKHLFRILASHGHLLANPHPGVVGVVAAKPDDDLIQSVDVMLEFRKQKIVAYRPGAPPFKLVFAKESDNGLLRAYYVAVVHKGTEFMISQQAQGAVKGRKNVVIFLLDDIGQADAIQAPFEHYYAIPGNHGYRFYEGRVTG